MTKQTYSKYQQRIISNYYDNMDTIMLQKLQDLVTDLYLAEGDKQKRALWLRAEKAMVKLKVPPEVISRIMEAAKVEVLAKYLEQWLKK